MRHPIVISTAGVGLALAISILVALAQGFSGDIATKTPLITPPRRDPTNILLPSTAARFEPLLPTSTLGPPEPPHAPPAPVPVPIAPHSGILRPAPTRSAPLHTSVTPATRWFPFEAHPDAMTDTVWQYERGEPWRFRTPGPAPAQRSEE